MQSKYKIVLSLSQELNIPPEEIQQYVHWYKLQTGINYEFVRLLASQNFISYELENDIKTFIAKDYLSKKRYDMDLKPEEKFAVQCLKNKIAKGEKFIPPEFVHEPKQKRNTLFTIGYEGISIDTYINKLLANHIKTLVDVRKNAYSNKFGFSKKEFQHCLEKSGIKYIHIPDLGIENAKRQNLKTAKKLTDAPLFEVSVKVVESQLFEDYKVNLPSKQKHIEKLLHILEQDKLIVITCFEVDHQRCHRHTLAKSLSGVEVVHL